MSFANKRFGKLTVLKEISPNVFLCACKCGARVERWRSQLVNNVARCCGCSSNLGVHLGHTRYYRTRSGKSGMRTSGEFNSWKNMRERCSGSTRPDYSLYGGRGVRVCERWNAAGTGFANFVADMGPRPAGTTLDRIDPQGHYEPTNCRWADRDVQAQNKRCNLYPDGEPPLEDSADMERRLEEMLNPF